MLLWDLVRTAQDGSSPLSRKGFLIDTMRGVPYLKKKKKRKDMYVAHWGEVGSTWQASACCLN